MKLPGDGTRVDVFAPRTIWPLKIAVGIPPPRSSAVPSASASKRVATLGAGMGQSFGNLTDCLDKVSIPSRTLLPTATGPRSLCVSLVTTRSSVTSATTVGVVNKDPGLEKLTFRFNQFMSIPPAVGSRQSLPEPLVVQISSIPFSEKPQSRSLQRSDSLTAPEIEFPCSKISQSSVTDLSAKMVPRRHSFACVPRLTFAIVCEKQRIDGRS